MNPRFRRVFLVLDSLSALSASSTAEPLRHLFLNPAFVQRSENVVQHRPDRMAIRPRLRRSESRDLTPTALAIANDPKTAKAKALKAKAVADARMKLMVDALRARVLQDGQKLAWPAK